MNHQARRVIHDLDESIILKQPDITFYCCVKIILMVVLASERGHTSRNSSDQRVHFSRRCIDKPRLGTKYDWHVVVPECNTNTHTQFISRDMHIMAVTCHQP